MHDLSNVEFPEGDEARGAEDHHQDEEQRDDDPLVDLQRPQGFAEQAQAHRARDGAVDGVEAAEIDHGQHLGQLLDAEGAGVDVPENVGVDAAGHPGPEGGEHEGHHFGAAGVDGHGVGGHLVVPDGVEGFAQGGADEIVDDPDAQHGPDEDRGEVGVVGLSAQPPGPAHEFQVLDHALDDKQKRQGDDGQVVPPGPERGDGDDQGAQGGDQAAEDESDGKQNRPQRLGQQRVAE